jgi:TonB family protein
MTGFVLTLLLLAADAVPDSVKPWQMRAERSIAVRRRSVLQCYERELIVSPKLRGKVVLRLTIAPTGRVSDASIEASTLQSDTVESCIVARARTWRAPPPPDGEAELLVPFIFTTSN